MRGYNPVNAIKKNGADGNPTGDLMTVEEVLVGAAAASQRSVSHEDAMMGATPVAGTHAVLTAGAAAADLTTLMTGAGASKALQSDCNYVSIDVETDALRLTLDGTTPTSSIGHQFAAGFKGLTLNRAEVTVCKVIRVTTDATIQISQFK